MHLSHISLLWHICCQDFCSWSSWPYPHTVSKCPRKMSTKVFACRDQLGLWSAGLSFTSFCYFISSDGFGESVYVLWCVCVCVFPSLLLVKLLTALLLPSSQNASGKHWQGHKAIPETTLLQQLTRNVHHPEWEFLLVQLSRALCCSAFEWSHLETYL